MLSLRHTVSHSLALLSIAIPSGVMCAQTVGWTYTTNVTIDSSSGRRSSMAMRVQATADKLRMEFVQVSGAGDAGEAEGMYTIMSPRDSTMTMVMPSQRMATINSTGLVGGMSKSMVPAFDTHVTRHSFVDLGPGDRMLGHATHHYRVSTTETSNITIAGQTCTRSSDSDSEMWIAPDVDLQPAMQAAAAQYGRAGIQTVGVDTTVTGPALPKGAALRTIVTTTMHPRGGTPVTTTMKIEIVELAHGPIDDALFAIPQDYRTMDMRAMMANLPAGLIDSIVRAQGPKVTGNICDSE